MLLRPGQVFAGYTIVRVLGAGGMGAVYLAQDPELPRQVALKVLDERLGANPRYRSLFRREADMVCRLDHPNVVSVHTRGVEGDALWIAMQFVSGTDAGELIRREHGGLAPERAAHIVREAARGLQHAHDQNMLHRDVKPSNLLVATGDDGTDRIMVVDFGLARTADEDATVTETGWLDCTPAYAAPEVLAGRSADRRADIYSLGATLLALLTGSNPSGRSPVPQAAATEPGDGTPAPTRTQSELPPALDAVIARAMADEPEARFQSCTEFARAIAAAVDGDESPVRPADQRRRYRWLAIAGGITVAAVVAAVIAVAVLPGESAGPGGPAPSHATAPKTTKHCYWRVRVPVDPGGHVELPSAAADHDQSDCVLMNGDHGDSVAALQQALALCHQIPLATNRTYDAATKNAVMHEQTESGADKDGIYGPQTRAKAMRWPVFRDSDDQFDGHCVPKP
ncbi:serine/threonine-protein kinase [Nocardia transvalensis]|uniref:non-specific serine/threonine protein kinase n=1 Tax=Nocardia transvalensis TaxID=37333 RepID=A0A7W9PDU7_9NOCA|nr:serine/threonine-protein kinase [Nocardia transvalensis]MBB5913873.1 serine/threonine-protein kinase [Nocardia transvalensis]